MRQDGHAAGQLCGTTARRLGHRKHERTKTRRHQGYAPTRPKRRGAEPRSHPPAINAKAQRRMEVVAEWMCHAGDDSGMVQY